MKEKKARVEDAMHATRAAVEEGIVPGGGVALVRAAKALENFHINADERDSDEQIGVNIVRRALEEPLRQIVQNAGFEGAVVVEMVHYQKNENVGFNAATEQFEDLVKAGVIDPAKVTRTALQNAASIAGMMLTTEATILEADEAVAHYDTKYSSSYSGSRTTSFGGYSSSSFSRSSKSLLSDQLEDTFQHGDPVARSVSDSDSELDQDQDHEREDTTPERFHFSLEGERTVGDKVQLGSDVDLVFNYSIPDVTALAEFKGKELEQVLRQDLDLGIAITPKGFTFRDETWHRVASFYQGKLKNPIRFLLRAGRKEIDDAGFYITLDVQGYVIYQFHLGVELVASTEGLKPKHSWREIDLDLGKLLEEKKMAAEAIEEEKKSAPEAIGISQ